MKYLNLQCLKKITFIWGILFFTSGCGTQTGNGVVTVEFSAYSAGALARLGLPPKSVTSVKMCFKRLRFKATSTSGEDNIDLPLGEVTLDSSGTSLSQVTIPSGTYTRIEFDLNKDCASGKSLQIENSSGTFTTESTTTIKFDGTFTMTQSHRVLSLGIQNIINKLNEVNSNGQLKDKAEEASGSF